MKTTLRILAVAIALAAAIIWAALGANPGWTINNAPRTITDKVTGIEGITYEKKFVPGLDFLGAAFIGAGILAGVSLLFRTKSTPSIDQKKP